MTISEISRRLNICRLTVRKRLREGWSTKQIQEFYKTNKRFNQTVADSALEIQLINEIEQRTGESFICTVRKILQFTNKTEEISKALGITAKQFEICSKILTANELLKIQKR